MAESRKFQSSVKPEHSQSAESGSRRAAGGVWKLRCLTAAAAQEQSVCDPSLDPHQQATDFQQHAADA